MFFFFFFSQHKHGDLVVVRVKSDRNWMKFFTNELIEMRLGDWMQRKIYRSSKRSLQLIFEKSGIKSDGLDLPDVHWYSAEIDECELIERKTEYE